MSEKRLKTKHIHIFMTRAEYDEIAAEIAKGDYRDFSAYIIERALAPLTEGKGEKVSSARPIKCSVRMDEETYSRIAEMAQQCGLAVGSYCRVRGGKKSVTAIRMAKAPDSEMDRARRLALIGQQAERLRALLPNKDAEACLDLLKAEREILLRGK